MNKKDRVKPWLNLYVPFGRIVYQQLPPQRKSYVLKGRTEIIPSWLKQSTQKCGAKLTRSRFSSLCASHVNIHFETFSLFKEFAKILRNLFHGALPTTASALSLSSCHWMKSWIISALNCCYIPLHAGRVVKKNRSY